MSGSSTYEFEDEGKRDFVKVRNLEFNRLSKLERREKNKQKTQTLKKREENDIGAM